MNNLKIFGIVIFLLIGFTTCKSVYNNTTNLYNSSVTLTNEFNQAMTERQGFYDKMWKSYASQKNIASLNKETFVEVTKIIMENRKDGVNLSWKWVSENQQIPYSEFTKFYENLSSYITTQREEYNLLENRCQTLATKHNTMLLTFPNNVYNMFLKRQPVIYKYGFLSTKTNTTFETGIEELDL